MFALRLRQATAGILVIGILLSVLGFCALVQIIFATIKTKGLVTRMLGEQQSTSISNTKSDYWKDKHWNDTNGLLWFVQITDLHLSKFRAPERAEDFEKFCIHLKNVIKPQVVLATGDLTDAKTQDHIGSQQFVEEWKTYNNVLKNCEILHNKDIKWLDLRGNHDTFNLENDDDPNNLYLKYSNQGSLGNRRSYHHFVRPKSLGPSFAFVGIDFTLTPSPKRPFNFFGVLSDHDMDEVEDMLETASKPENSQGGLIAFGHYPLSTVLTPGRGGISAVIGRVGVVAYLSGHIHSLLGLAPEIYTKQSDGYLDLELTDWKDSRQYRIAALDRGQLSFIDQPFMNTKVKNKNAVVLITNPLDARFVYGKDIENTVKQMRESTHIRILVFSPTPVKSVVVTIDDGESITCDNFVTEENSESKEQSPLYLAAWEPKKLAVTKSHSMKVIATISDEKGSETTVTTTRQFVLDTKALDIEGSEEDFKFVSRAILMSNLSMVLQVLFALSIAGLVLPLCLLRFVHRLTLDGQISKPASPLLSDAEEDASPKKERIVVRPCNCISVCLRKWLRRFWLLANINHLCYPLIGYVLFIAVGPWSVGYFLGDHVGVIFSWGMYIKGSLLPTQTTLLYGVFFIMPYIYLLMIGVAWNVDRKLENLRTRNTDVPNTFCRYFLRHLWFVILMLLQSLHCLEFYLAYGLLAFFSVPGAARLIFSFYMWIQATSIKIEEVPRDIFRVWSTKSEKSCS